MIMPLSNELYASSVNLLTTIIPDDTISPEFDAYLTDTAIAIRYSGIIPALLNNESQGKAGRSGLVPSLVNRMLVKLLRDFFGYPEDLSFETIKNICSNSDAEFLLKDHLLEILASLKFAAKTYLQRDDFSFDQNSEVYSSLESECALNIQNFTPNNDPALDNGTIANLRLAYYSYLETARGYQSWFDHYGLVKVHNNIHSKLYAYREKFDVNSQMLPKPKDTEFGSFELMVGSRGLLVGTGYPHLNLMNEEKKSDFQLGFFFDYTSGFPLIPASSIKGFLRAGFPPTSEDELMLERLREQMALADITGLETFDFNKSIQLKHALFGDVKKPSRSSMFFNAFITKQIAPPYDQGRNIPCYVDEDWLAPHLHKGERSQLREPNPIRFLKIIPGVVFKFSFLADRTDMGDGLVINPQQKIALFKTLLTNRNFGAKHRTGFGSFWELQL